MPSILTSVCVLVGWHLVWLSHYGYLSFSLQIHLVDLLPQHLASRLQSVPPLPCGDAAGSCISFETCTLPCSLLWKELWTRWRRGENGWHRSSFSVYFFSLHSNFWSHSHSRWSGFVRTGTRSSSVSWMKDWCSAKQLPLRIDLMVSVHLSCCQRSDYFLPVFFHSTHTRTQKNRRLE